MVWDNLTTTKEKTMFAYNPGVTDQSGQIIAQGAQNAALINAQMMSDFGQNIGNAIAQIGDAYSERKQLEAKASSYDDIGKILGTAMFANNPDAMGALGNLKKEKDPRKKVMGYEQLFSLVGPMSNMMMAQGRMGIQQDQQALTAAMPRARAVTQAQAQVAAGQGTVVGMPPDVNPQFVR
jgi:hypothetical protein